MAQIRLRDTSGTLHTVARVRLRDETNTLRTIQRIRLRDASGILRTVYEAMTAALSPTTVSETAATSTITTGTTCTATPTGGTAPYTYAWHSADSSVDLAIRAFAATSATTAFIRTGCVSGDTYYADFYCVVTDALGFSATTGLVSVDITRS